MSLHPSRIWASVNGVRTRLPTGEQILIGGWEAVPGDKPVEYIRADVVDQMIAEALTQAAT